MSEPVRIVIVDEQAAARRALKAVLTLCPEIDIVGEAGNSQQAMALVTTLNPRVVLMDVQIRVTNDLHVVRSIKNRWPATKVIVLTAYAAKRTEALAAGADCFVLKGDAFETLRDAIVRASSA
ncbi:MAG: response regulator transcription factor [Caldilineaceae bacterium]|nr:response regulator transcription factor [Caldilineaceae bacterium]